MQDTIPAEVPLQVSPDHEPEETVTSDHALQDSASEDGPASTSVEPIPQGPSMGGALSNLDNRWPKHTRHGTAYGVGRDATLNDHDQRGESQEQAFIASIVQELKQGINTLEDILRAKNIKSQFVSPADILRPPKPISCATYPQRP